MKKLIAITYFLFLIPFIQAQVLNLNEVRMVKNAKTIVALTGNAEFDKKLKSAVQNFWSFNEVVEYLPEKEAKKKAKADDNLVFIGFDVSNSLSTTFGSFTDTPYRLISSSMELLVSIGGNAKPLMITYIPAFGKERYVTEESLAFGISELNYKFQMMDQHELKSSLKYKSIYKKYSQEVAEKTLYVLEGWLDLNKKKDDIKELYNFPVEVVNYETWKEAILKKKEGIAYVVVVPVPLGGKYVYLHYLMDAQTGKVFAIVKPKVGLSIGGINLSKKNTGYINKKNLEAYDEVAKGKW